MEGQYVFHKFLFISRNLPKQFINPQHYLSVSLCLFLCYSRSPSYNCHIQLQVVHSLSTSDSAGEGDIFLLISTN